MAAAPSPLQRLLGVLCLWAMVAGARSECAPVSAIERQMCNGHAPSALADEHAPLIGTAGFCIVPDAADSPPVALEDT